MIEFACPHCDRAIRVSPNAAGKSGRCNDCGEKIRVPHQTEVIHQPQVELFPAAGDQPPSIVVPHQTQITVEQPKSRSNSFGVASLIIAVLAFPLSWIPLINVVTIPVSLLALLCGGIGTLLALFRRGSGLGFCVAAGLLAAVNLSLTWVSNKAVTDAVHESVEESRKRLEADRINSPLTNADGQTTAEPSVAAVVPVAAVAPEVPAKPTNPLTLASWKYSVEKDEFAEYYNIEIQLTNTSDKGIKLIDGSVRFYDLLDDYIYGMSLDKDVTIPAGGTVADSGLYRINRFISRESRLKSMNSDDVRARLSIRKIVFDDNTILDLTD